MSTTAESVSKQNGRIVFKTGMTLWGFGREFAFVIIDNGDGTRSGDVTKKSGQLVDWGEGKAIIDKVTSRAVSILSEQGGEEWFH